MVSYLARTLPVLISARLRRDGARKTQISRRVGLHEIDLNRHMNQAVYAQVFELGRADWIVRSGVWRELVAQRVNPVVAEQRIVYRRELGPFTRYTIDTRAVGVVGRLLEVQSHVIVGDRVHTRAEVKLLFLGPEGTLSGEAAARLCAGWIAEPLAVSDWKLV
jgi:acyl-CoA thioesterase FadM